MWDWSREYSDLSSSPMEEEEDRENEIFWQTCNGRLRDVEGSHASCPGDVLESETVDVDRCLSHPGSTVIVEYHEGV